MALPGNCLIMNPLSTNHFNIGYPVDADPAKIATQVASVNLPKNVFVFDNGGKSVTGTYSGIGELRGFIVTLWTSRRGNAAIKALISAAEIVANATRDARPVTA